MCTYNIKCKLSIEAKAVLLIFIADVTEKSLPLPQFIKAIDIRYENIGYRCSRIHWLEVIV